MTPHEPRHSGRVSAHMAHVASCYKENEQHHDAHVAHPTECNNGVRQTVCHKPGGVPSLVCHPTTVAQPCQTVNGTPTSPPRVLQTPLQSTTPPTTFASPASLRHKQATPFSSPVLTPLPTPPRGVQLSMPQLVLPPPAALFAPRASHTSACDGGASTAATATTSTSPTPLRLDGDVAMAQVSVAVAEVTPRVAHIAARPSLPQKARRRGLRVVTSATSAAATTRHTISTGNSSSSSSRSAMAVNARSPPRLFSPARKAATTPDGMLSLHRVVGRGSAARVFVASPARLSFHDDGARYAVKVASASSGAAECLRREARVLSRLLPLHPHIIRVPSGMAVSRSDGTGSLFLPLELADGGDLMDYLQSRTSPVSLGDALALLSHVAHALAHCHAHSVYHLDVKPENILRVTPGAASGGVWKLADFGSASTSRYTPKIETTAAYAPPEVLAGPSSAITATATNNGGGHAHEGRPPAAAKTTSPSLSPALSRGEEVPSAASSLAFVSPSSVPAPSCTGSVTPPCHQHELDAAAADVWSLGITLFAVLHRYQPWKRATMRDRHFRAFAHDGIFSVKPVRRSTLSEHASDAMHASIMSLIRSMLQVDPAMRPSAAAIARRADVLLAAAATATEPTATTPSSSSAAAAAAATPTAVPVVVFGSVPRADDDVDADMGGNDEDEDGDEDDDEAMSRVTTPRVAEDDRRVGLSLLH